MRIPLLIIATSLILTSSAFNPNGAEQVALAELAFARTSVETNTVNAFRKYLAKDAIMFREGEPVDGLELWNKRTPDSTLLKWWPVMADASQAGELGYTTGPYQFFSKRTDRTPVANGYYSTIWKKQEDGSWKIKLDLGVPLAEIKELPTELSYALVTNESQQASARITDLDSDYNKLLNKNSTSFTLAQLGKNYRLHRPLIGAKINSTYEVADAEKRSQFQFEFVGGEESASRDLAYTYGKVKRTENGKEKKLNYLRVWKNEGGNWKIVLDVVTEG